MISIDRLERLVAAVKHLKSERLAMDKKSRACSTMPIGPAYKRAVANLEQQARAVEKAEHSVHVAIVEAGLADPYPPEYYQQASQNDGWHSFAWAKKAPSGQPHD